eukprot:CAMPEP_0194507510 /NCGR_PEP_ID=MMETSP0253-20130528/37106_1 /TAXON_ID=2966 /ORGANISM="Noctiluca scintillans" /LENGTH=88 /DNA_ID=CAMNT_0039350415 /DNA_START=48 /DNA_END=314 /DNA_ORIENTATION=-
MSSVDETRNAVRAFSACVKDKSAASCDAERAAVVSGIASAVKGECAPYTEDFFACFSHRYRLSTCNDSTVGKLLKCQEQLSSTLLSNK